MANFFGRIFWKRFFLVLAIALIAITAIAGTAIYVLMNTFGTPTVVNSNETTVSKTADSANKCITILLMGLDDGDIDNPGAPRRADTMMVVSINPGDGTVNLLSVPRDTRVTIPGRSGEDKITHAYFYGGPKLAVRTVENLLDIPIDYYVAIDWQAFIKVIDILGGLDINVEQAMNYDDPYEDLHIHLNKGYQHLDGQKAGEYVRFRHDELGDIGRVQRQQRFLRALTNELLQAGTILKLPALVATLNRYVQTDMPVTYMVKLASSLKGLKLDGLHAEMVPGDFSTINDISYWKVDGVKTRQLVQNMFKSGSGKPAVY